MAARPAAGSVSAQALEPADGADCFLAHAEFSEAGQLDNLASRQAADHRIAAIAPLSQCRQYGTNMVLKKKHRRNHDVAARDIGKATVECLGIRAPLVGGVHIEFEARQIATQRSARTARGASQVAVHRHDDDPIGVRSAAEVRFCIVQCLDRDGGEASLHSEAFGIAACLAAHKERYLAEFALRVGGPLRDRRRLHRRLTARCRRLGRQVDRFACSRQMRRRGVAVEFPIFAKQTEEMFLKAHHQRMNESVENDVGAFETHLRRVARGKVLDVDGRRNHGAGDTQALGDVALHLGAEHQIGLKLCDFGLHLKVIVGDERLDVVKLGGIPNFTSELTRIGP